jgi:hypothetical protein
MFARSIDLRRELRFISKDIIMTSQVEDDAKEAYDSVFHEDADPSHRGALRVLMLGEGPRRSGRRPSCASPRV